MQIERKKCVYKIECLCNHKVYIGQTYDFNERIKRHMRDLACNKHFNDKLQLDYNIFHAHNFTSQILEVDIDECNIKQRETYFINYFGGIESENVYNYDDNTTQNKEKCKRISNTLKHKIQQGEYTPYQIGLYGDKNPAKRPEVRAKLSHKLLGEGNGMYGKHHSAESKRKMSEALKGRTAWNKGKSNTKLKGIPRSEETKRKLSNTRKQKLATGEIIHPNKGKRKYSEEKVEEIRLKYKELNYNIEDLREFYYDINKQTLNNLLKYGTANPPSSYK